MAELERLQSDPTVMPSQAACQWSTAQHSTVVPGGARALDKVVEVVEVVVFRAVELEEHPRQHAVVHHLCRGLDALHDVRLGEVLVRGQLRQRRWSDLITARPACGWCRQRWQRGGCEHGQHALMPARYLCPARPACSAPPGLRLPLAQVDGAIICMSAGGIL